MVFTVKTNFFASEVTLLVMSKGQLEIVNTLAMYSKQKTFSIALSRQLLPSARIIVYTMVNDHVLMDSMNIHIKDSKLTSGSLKRNLGKDFTRTTLELIGRGPIGSFMSLIGQHYQWVLRGADTFITEKKIMRDLNTYTTNETEPYHHIWYYNDTRWDEDIYFTSETAGLDGNTTLKGAGLLAITDMRLSFAMGDELVCNITLGQGQCISGQCFDLSLACDGWPDCPDGYDEAGCADLTPPVERPKEDLSLFPFYTLYLDNDWNFITSYVKPNLGGQVELSLEAPEVLDTYVFHSFFIHPTDGIMLINESVVYNLTRWFFMRCEGPEQLRRGEQVGIRCALFNKWDQILEVMVMLHGSHKFRFINVEDFGIVSSYAPRTTAGDIQIMIPMFPGEERYIIWPLQPHVVKDDITVKISAMSVIHRDEEELNIPIIYDGCINEVYTVYWIDLVAYPSMYTPYLDTEIPQNWYQPGQRDLLYIPGSPKGLVSVWGGVGVPGFWLDYYDADLAAGLPHDCLEGYIFDFAYNWLNLDYLQAINRLDDDDKIIVLDYMRTTLMRQYAYLTDEGGFKMFRRAKSPVVWLTAVCLNYMNDFFKSDWAEEVFIPVDILNRIVLWLVKQQNSEGAFIETSEHIYNRYFHNISMTTTGVNQTWSMITTSYVVQTLAKCTLLTGEAKRAAADAVVLGADYIAERFFYLVDVLDVSTAAMALERAQHPLKDDAYYKLKSMARHERHTYFSNVYIEPNPIKMVDNKQIIGTRFAPEILGAACTATGWALDLYLIHNEFEAAKPIVIWLIEQHMDFFTLAACVDTLIGVEAMNNYAKRETNYHFTNMKISITAQSTEGWEQVIYINYTNYPNYHQFFMPEPCWGTIAAHAEGTGFARFQVFTDHQVEKIYQVWTTPYDTFRWTMNEVEYLGRNASIMRPNYCVKWIRPDMSPAAGMTNLWWFTPSGYVVDRDEIEMKYRDIENTGMIRIRPKGGINWVWHEYIDTEGWCFNTTLRRWYPISNYSVSYFIGVYEYSEPSMYDFTGYSTYTLHNLHICQVCGSFQCPYCLWYNSASSLSASTLLVAGVFCCWHAIVRLVSIVS